MAQRSGALQHSTRSAELSPMALSILGLEQAGFLPTASRSRRSGRGDRNAQSDRRVTSYYNHFYSRTTVSNDPPPSYANASREARFAPSQPAISVGEEQLPAYSCSVFKEGPMQMLLESCSPFMTVPLHDWRPVYLIVQGTGLYIHKLKTVMVDKQQVLSAGRLLRTYTLQHAEVGLAPDVSHTTVVPLTRLASLIPPLARKKAHEKDPSLFKIDRQYAMRVRSELDQFVLTSPAEEQIMSWVNHISAGIDIAPALDERSLPRQCTMPRRRRRPQRPVTAADMSDERFIEQQRRLLSQYASNDTLMVPPRSASVAVQPSRSLSVISDAASQAASRNPSVMPDVDQEDIDLSELAEDLRPNSTLAEDAVRSASHVAATMLNSEPLNNFDEDGKWAPPHARSLTQQWRYIRRCMPILLVDTPRHSSVMINDGHYIRPNYKYESLDKWALQPPTYEAHNFDKIEEETPEETVVESSTAADLAVVTSSSASSRSGSSTDMPRVDSTACPSDAITVATINVPTITLELKAFDLEKNIAQTMLVRPTHGTKRENSKMSTASTDTDVETPVAARTIFGF